MFWGSALSLTYAQFVHFDPVIHLRCAPESQMLQNLGGIFTFVISVMIAFRLII